MDIRFDIKGDRRIGLRFDQFPDALRLELKAKIDDLANQLYAMVRARTPNRTGRLLSQEGVKVFDDKDKISGKVFVLAEGRNDAVKAATLEYGSTGKSTGVGAHMMRLDHYWSQALARPINVLVAAYSRTPDVTEFAFERGPLAEIQPQVEAELNAVVLAATKAANA